MSKKKEGERKENDPVLFFRFQGILTGGTEQNFTRGRGGGGLRPEVQPLALLYTSFDRRSTPFESHLVNITNDTPFTYTKLPCLFHSYKIHLLGPSADRNNRFPYHIL